MADIQQWVEDGHRIVFRWERDSILVDHISCPFEHSGNTAFCRRRRDYCVVQRFIGVFGQELNFGTTVIDGPVEVAWIGVIGDSDLDDEFASVWVIPVDDPEYRDSQRSLKNPEN